MSSPSRIRRQSETEVLNIADLKNRNATYAKSGCVRSWCAQGENTFNAFNTFIEEEAVVFSPCGDVLKSYWQTGCVRRSRGANNYIVRILQEDSVIYTTEAACVMVEQGGG